MQEKWGNLDDYRYANLYLKFTSIVDLKTLVCTDEKYTVSH